jgi:hypothetical protein
LTGHCGSWVATIALRWFWVGVDGLVMDLWVAKRIGLWLANVLLGLGLHVMTLRNKTDHVFPSLGFDGFPLDS